VTMPLESIKTPCVGICELVVPWGICKGCGRTESELGAWVGMSDDERKRTMLECESRLDILRLEQRLLNNEGQNNA
jgi:uncharacterized protein